MWSILDRIRIELKADKCISGVGTEFKRGGVLDLELQRGVKEDILHNICEILICVIWRVLNHFHPKLNVLNPQFVTCFIVTLQF